jgi:hypothetical protein
MFCYPFGRFDAEAKELVAQAGFKGARTTQQFVIAPPTDRFAIATTLHVYRVLLRRDNARDFGAYLFKSYAGPSPWHACFDITVSMLRGWSHCAELLFQRSAPDAGAVFHLWGHSWEIQSSGMWGQLDGFLKLIGGFNALSRKRSSGEPPGGVGCLHGSALLLPAPLPACGYPARDLAIPSIHTELPRR